MVVDTHTGEVMQRTDYDEFGLIIDEDLAQGFQPVIFGYAGGLQDRDTGLIRFGARDYDPMVGRWTSKEPLGFNGSSNFYVYAENDPVNYVDVTGLEAVACSSLIDAVTNASRSISTLYYGQSNEKQEYGTMIMKQGACYFYTPILKGPEPGEGDTIASIGISKIHRDAIKQFPNAIPIASIHNHPSGSTATTYKVDDPITAGLDILNITLLKQSKGHAVNTTRGEKKDKGPFPEEVRDAYRVLSGKKIFIMRK